MEIRGHELQDFAENCRLSKKQERALLELVNPSNRSLEEAANRAGISIRTLHYWLKLPHFKERLIEERSKLRDQAFDMLKANLTKAVERLGVLLDSESETVGLKACQMVLDYNIKLIEQEDFEARLSKLEEADDEEEGYD